MAARHQELRPEMKWLEMDVLDLKFNEGDFDLVVDKGKLSTSRLVSDSQGRWSKTDIAAKVANDAARCLRPREIHG